MGRLIGAMPCRSDKFDGGGFISCRVQPEPGAEEIRAARMFIYVR
jgi:hypothetical protein